MNIGTCNSHALSNYCHTHPPTSLNRCIPPFHVTFFWKYNLFDRRHTNHVLSDGCHPTPYFEHWHMHNVLSNGCSLPLGSTCTMFCPMAGIPLPTPPFEWRMLSPTYLDSDTFPPPTNHSYCTYNQYTILCPIATIPSPPPLLWTGASPPHTSHFLHLWFIWSPVHLPSYSIPHSTPLLECRIPCHTLFSQWHRSPSPHMLNFWSLI